MSDAAVHIALIRESDQRIVPTQVVTLEAHREALCALRREMKAEPGITPAPQLPIHITHQEAQ